MSKTNPENPFIEIGKRIAARRKALGMTQLELAEKVDTSNNHLSSIENGTAKPSIDLFLKLYEALETTPNHLILGCTISKSLPERTIDTIRNLNEENAKIVSNHANLLYLQQLGKL
jgi:transcriptional regulator with XRE-family HTH domain